ncbi:MAG: PKD domain-containing protein [Bacteroidota bacterium]
MYRSLVMATLMWFLSSPLSLQAQLPPNQPEQDCFLALPVCQDIYVQPNAYSGAGEDPDEITGTNSCMVIGERNSVWYTFTVQNGGNLCFTIVPVDPLDDYDWALFDLSNASCADIPNNASLEVSCNWTFNNGCGGQTGANGSLNCPEQNEPCLIVQAGQRFALNVSNFTASNSGYTLDFSQASAQLYDDDSPEISGMTSFCHGVTVEFDEPVLCSTVDAADFTFTGPGGPYQFSAVLSPNCRDDGSGYSRSFDLVVSPPISQPDFYTVSLVGSVTDFCGNVALPATESVFMPQPPIAEMNPVVPQCQEDNVFGFGYTGPSNVQSYNWNFGDGGTSRQSNPLYTYQNFGTFDVSLVIRDDNGCRDTAIQEITVYPAPVAVFDAPSTMCQGDTLALSSLAYAPGDANLTSMRWLFSDGGVTEEPTPERIFSWEGPQWVLLEVYNDYQCRDTSFQHVLVYPQADVAFQVEEDVCIGDTANLVYQSTIRNDIADDRIVDWYWDMGDSTQRGAIRYPAHVYDTAGVFPVTLNVLSDKGCWASLTQDQIIHQPPPPVVVDTPVCFGERAYLQGIPTEGAQTFWYEQFEDALPFQEGAVYFSPPVTINDTLFAEVIDHRGCISPRVPISLLHHEIGQGEIAILDTILEFPQPIADVRMLGTINGAKYAWKFGDGSTSNLPNPVYEYPYPGLYNIELAVEDVHGCRYDLSQLVEVKHIPLVQIPSGFTPNGDGFNDEFFIHSQMIRDFSFQVFNRFGTLMYQSEDPAFRWDGFSKSGKVVMPGVYTYYVQARDLLGNLIRKDGTITVIR